MTPSIQVQALLKQRDSLSGIQRMFVLLMVFEVAYMMQVIYFWSSAWPSAAAVALSAAILFLTVAEMWNLEMLKQVPFANRLAQLM